MIKRIAITGPESTGKTHLAEQLAAHYQTIHVPDYSRTYVSRLEKKYNHKDVLEIGKGIIEQENHSLQFAHRILFSDNDLINIKIWLQYYKWHVPDWLTAAIVKRKYDLYLLCNIDLQWVADGQRENESDREFLMNRFKEELEAIQANYTIISGHDEKRLQHALTAIEQFI